MQTQTIEHQPAKKARRSKHARTGKPRGSNQPKGVTPTALVPYRWQPGQTGNPNGFQGVYGHVMALARERSPRAVAKLCELIESPDDRVALMAADKLLERAWGKPKEVQDDKASGPPDLGALNAADLAELRRISAKMRGGVDAAQDGPRTATVDPGVASAPPDEPDPVAVDE